jgi:hypothetical protein
MSATIFDTNFKSSGITLSGGSLTATVTSGTSNVGADHRVSGLTFFEMAIGASLTGSVCVGLVNNGFNTASGTLLGVDANSIGYKNDGTVRINNVLLTTIATYAATNVIGVAINPQLELIWFRVGAGGWNNDILANQDPASNIGGINLATLPCAGLRPAFGGTTVTPNQSATATFTSGFANTPPSGYITIDTVASNTAAEQPGVPLETGTPSSANMIPDNLTEVLFGIVASAGAVPSSHAYA